MRFNGSGSAATGVSVTVGIDGSTPAALSTLTGGAQWGPAWISSTEVVFQNGGVSGAGPWVLSKYNTGSTAITTLSANSSNTQSAGGTIWALARVGLGVLTNNPAGSFPDGWLGDVSEFGELGVILTYPNLIGLSIFDSAGASLFSDSTVGLVTTLVRIRSHIVAYWTKSGWQLKPLGPFTLRFAPRLDTSVSWVTPVRTATAGVTYVMERSDQLTVRASDSGNGFVIAAPGTFTYNPDVMEVSSGVLRFGWCSNAGETADSLFVADFTLATSVLKLYAVSGGVLVLQSTTTLTPTTFSVGPVQGEGSNPSAIPNDQQTIIKQTGAASPPMRKWMQAVSSAISTNSNAIASTPPAVPQNAFGHLASTSQPTIAATQPADTLTLTSSNNSVSFASNPATKTLDVTATGTGGTVTTTGSPASGNLTKFSGATTITNGDLSGDVTTTSTLATTIAANAVTTTKIINAAVTLAKIANAAANSRLVGSGSSGAGAAYSEITLGSGLSMSSTTLSATGTGGTVTTTGSPASGNLTKFSGSSSITNADLTGDITTSGTVATTLSNSGATAGTYGSATKSAVVTVDVKGRVTTISETTITGSGTSPGGSDTQIQFNDSSTFGGDANLTWDKTANKMSITGASGLTVSVSNGTVTGGIYQDATFLEFGTTTAHDVAVFTNNANPTFKVLNAGGSQFIRSTIPTTLTNANAFVQLGSSASATNGYWMIRFGYLNGTNGPAYFGYQEINDTGDTYGDFFFSTRSVTTNTAPTERLRITNAGEVDIKLALGFGTKLADSATAPTISSGFGSSASIAANNGTVAFTVNVGTGGTASSGVIGMPTASTGWICHVENQTGVAANRADQRTVQTASSTTSVTVQNQTISTGAALAWTASDILVLTCRAY